MSLKRRSKKILLASELLLLEEADIVEQDKEYVLEFASDFSQEYRFLKDAGRKKEKLPNPLKNFKVPKPTLKKLHRKLVLVTHPDHNGDAQKFHDVQEAYKNQDLSKMMAIAHEAKIDIALTKEEIEHLEHQIKIKKKSLKQIKSRVSWMWCQSDKSEKIRAQVRELLGIKQKDWTAWKKLNSQ